ncbi:MAG TPA: SRPBCC family protein [Amycolatopsis sp.]|nr:SRPBCC family protein [Amycolatopsis sp.]
MDIAGQINAIHREVRGRLVAVSRRYDASAEDIWHACTDPARLSRWFLPVSGDLRPGGTYRLKGNACGDIMLCEPPRLLRVTWIFGEGPGSVVELRLRPEGAATRLDLEHSGLTDDQHWDQFGPGAVGVGWDLALLGLALHLSGERIADPDEWGTSPEARDLMTQSAKAWGVAHIVSGEDPAQATAAAARTTSFYVPPHV